jgi:superfamily II DNA or RNA helicase
MVPSSPCVASSGVCLRPYQTSAIERLDEAVCRGVRRVLVAAPTGSGKTVIAAALMRRDVDAGRRVLFLAHRRELIHQTVAKLLDAGVPEATIGVIMGNDPRRRPDAQIQVASVDTLRRRPLPPADVVIVDECHRAIARSHSSITERYPDALHIGYTATPYRGDGTGMRERYDEMIIVATPRLLIADGFILEPRVFTIPKGAMPDLRGVRVRGGDYDERALAEAMNQKRLVGNLVEHWLRLANNERTVVFAVNVAHSKHIAAQFTAAGIAAEHVDGTMANAERDAALARIASGETRVLCSCMLVSEGFDCPPLRDPLVST